MEVSPETKIDVAAPIVGAITRLNERAKRAALAGSLGSPGPQFGEVRPKGQPCTAAPRCAEDAQPCAYGVDPITRTSRAAGARPSGAAALRSVSARPLWWARGSSPEATSPENCGARSSGKRCYRAVVIAAPLPVFADIRDNVESEHPGNDPLRPAPRTHATLRRIGEPHAGHTTCCDSAPVSR